MHCRAKDMDAWLLSTITIVSLGLSQMATCNGLSGPMAKAVLQASLWTSLTKMLLLCICYHTVNNVRLIKYAALKQWLWKQYIRWSHLSFSPGTIAGWSRRSETGTSPVMVWFQQDFIVVVKLSFPFVYMFVSLSEGSFSGA